jgi:hypothetical protein
VCIFAGVGFVGYNSVWICRLTHKVSMENTASIFRD